MTISLIVLLFIIALFIRLCAVKKTGLNGCDAFYFLICREVFQKELTFKIDTKNKYLCEDPIQNYPQGFTYFLALIPNRVLEKYYWTISPIIDCFVLLIPLMLFDLNLLSVIIFVPLYLISFSSISETLYLTSRQLGVMLYILSVLSFYNYLSFNTPTSLFFTVITFILTFVTHKFSSQTLFFSMLYFTFAFKSFIPVLFFVGIYLLCILLTSGHQLQTLLSHFEFIKFWTKEQKMMGAHQLFDSNFYSSKGYQFESVFMKKLKFVKKYLFENSYILIVIAILLLNQANLSHFELIMFQLTLFVYFFGAITFFIPFMRGFGFGAQYGKYSLILFMCGIVNVDVSKLDLGIFLLSTFLYILVFFKLYRFFKSISLSANSRSDNLINFLKQFKEKRVFCLPSNLNDEIAYKTSHHMIWGTHSSPLKLVKSFYPVLQDKIENVLEKEEAEFLILEKNYINNQSINVPKWVIIFEDDHFFVLENSEIHFHP